MKAHIPDHLKGLTDEEVILSRKEFGYNKRTDSQEDTWLMMMLEILKEPMLLLLIAITILYVIVGDYSNAAFMFAAIVAVSGISLYQDGRSKNALKALEKLNEPLSKVIRNSLVVEIPTNEIAVGDLCLIEEGKLINADGIIVYSNDFSVNESALTGESLSVYKDANTEDNRVYNGTLVVSGLAIFKVEHIGASTKLGQIGDALLDIEVVKSPLQTQISTFVKRMAIIGVIIFLMVWAFSYYISGSIIDSLLNGLTMAMSVLPEEIPVAFTTFMALGAWKLMQDGIIIKRSSIVETLGSTTVICTDKTGTITKNMMELKNLYDYNTHKTGEATQFGDPEFSKLIRYAMWSSEPVPFDPMEKSIHIVFEQTQNIDNRKDFTMIHEYPLSGQPPMMTHIYENESKQRIIAAKGAPEAIINVCNLDVSEANEIRALIKSFGEKGYRVLGVANAEFDGYNFPENQQDFSFHFIGLVVFYDPPKEGIGEVFNQISNAGIQLKIITGDNAETTKAIAEQAGITITSDPVQGIEIAHLDNETLMDLAGKTTLFARMYPETKLAVINALKAKGEIVAMLGDGVNDAPALKSAHIGVAMGNKGTEIAKSASDLVITNDDLDKLILSIAAGRRIYTNIKKAIQYIISIHIPIILTVALPLFFGWYYPEIFTPVHVIFLELVMGPICSIAYESEPMEKNSMQQPPRNINETFLSRKELSISIVQGLIITIGVLFAYQFTALRGGSEETTRSMVFSTLVFSNIFLSLVNRSFYYSVWDSFKAKNSLLAGITLFAFFAVFAILFIPVFAGFFHVAPLSISELGLALLIAMISVLWFEVYKWIKRLRHKSYKYSKQ